MINSYVLEVGNRAPTEAAGLIDLWFIGGDGRIAFQLMGITDDVIDNTSSKKEAESTIEVELILDMTISLH